MKSYVSVAALALAIAIGTVGITSAAPGNETTRGERQSQREAVRAAVEANDYTAWVEAAQYHPKADEFVNEATFSKLRQAYELRESGDREGAKALLEEAGIKRSHKHGKHKKLRNPEARAAVEANDYSAWAEASANHPRADEFVTQDTFNVLRQAYALRESGDKEGARELMRNLKEQFRPVR